MSNSGMTRKILKYSGNIRFILANSIAEVQMELNNSKNAEAVFSLSLLSGGAAQKNETGLLLKSNEKLKNTGLFFPGSRRQRLSQHEMLHCSAREGWNSVQAFSAGLLKPSVIRRGFRRRIMSRPCMRSPDCFRNLKTETMDIVSDDELIDFMKEAFNGFCKGSLELLAGRALPMLAEHVRSGEPLESFIYRAEQYEQS